MSLRDKIKNLGDIPEETITVKEWDSDILVRGLNAKDRAVITRLAMDRSDNPETINYIDVMYEIIICCSFDPETKESAFNSEDTEWLPTKAGDAISCLYKKAIDLSGLGSDKDAVQD